ncbi:MAG TPA: hypothetical protein VN259_04185 [Xanthomonadales bacterium]|nr:hypothetical protein [Xanthomonadales bacterium]
MLSAPMQQFRRLVFSNAQLREALQAYPDDASFVTGTIQLASNFGIVLSAEEIREALAAGQREWLERWL